MSWRAYKTGDIDHIPSRAGDMPRRLMEPLIVLSDFASTLEDDEANVVSCVGVQYLWEGVMNVWQVVHPESSMSGLAIVRETRQILDDVCDTYAVKRSNGMAFNEESRKWMELLGFVQEGVKKGYGPDGQDVIDMVRWTRRGKRHDRVPTATPEKRRAAV